MKKLLLISILPLALAFTGCTSDGTLTPAASNVLSAAESDAWTAINTLETVNTATGGVLTTAAVNYALTSTHNSGDEAIANAAAAAANKVIAAQAAAHVSSGAANQAIATAVLNDPTTVQAATAAASN